MVEALAATVVIISPVCHTTNTALTTIPNMDEIEIIAPKSSKASSRVAPATTTTAQPGESIPLLPANSTNQSNKTLNAIQFNALNKTSGNGSPLPSSPSLNRSERKNASEENRRLLLPAPASLQLSKKFVVMPAATAAIASASASPSSTPLPLSHSQTGITGNFGLKNGIGTNNLNHLKSPVTTPTTTVIVTDNSSTDPSSTTSPIGSPSAMTGARPKHFQSMRSIRSGKYLTYTFHNSTYVRVSIISSYIVSSNVEERIFVLIQRVLKFANIRPVKNEIEIQHVSFCIIAYCFYSHDERTIFCSRMLL